MPAFMYPISHSALIACAPILLAQFLGHLQRRRFFHQLLVAALDAAFAFTQADDIAILVAQYLELDVARPLDELLHVEVTVPESRRSLRLRGVEHVRQVRLRRGSRACRVRRRPLGLHITGKPICCAHSLASSAVAMTPSDPGRIGTSGLLHRLARPSLFRPSAGSLPAEVR